MKGVEHRRPMPGSAASALAAEFEPVPRIGALVALRRHWLLALLPIIVLVPVVGVVAAKRTPKYSAEARLMAGQLNLSTAAAVAGYAQASQDLASTYPLMIYANPVIGRVARQLHISSAAVASGLTATSVPSSSIVRVDATAGSAKQAIDIANAASAALIHYVASFNRNNSDSPRLQKALLAANVAYEHAVAQMPSTSQGPLDPAGQRLKAKVDTARAAVAGLTSVYQQSLLNESASSLLRPLSSATGATSDKTRKLEIALFAAVIAGAILGVGLATLRANVVARRALTAPPWQPAGAGFEGDGGLADKPRPVRTTVRARSPSDPPNT